MRVLDFEGQESPPAWHPVHDRVMGGVSTGSVSRSDGALRFEGNVSLANGGGFASFRSLVDLRDLSGHEGLRLRVLGDGKTYKLSLRTDEGFDGVSWQERFPTEPGAWSNAEIAFSALRPTFRGRSVPDAGPFDPSGIRQLGILIADAQAGPFALELAWIEAF